MAKKKREAVALDKCPMGIKDLDEITKGGLPKGRPILICGPAGCGKTPADLVKNFLSLGFYLEDMASQGLIAPDHVYIGRREIEETGSYGLISRYYPLTSTGMRADQ